MTSSGGNDECRAYGHRRLASVWRDLSLDLRRMARASSDDETGDVSARKRISLLLTPQAICICIYRISHLLQVRGWRRLARFLATGNAFVHKVAISPASCIQGGLFLPHPRGVVFHGRAGTNLTLYSCSLCTSLHPIPWCPIEDGPRLGSHVTVGAHGGIHGPITVGDNTTIGFRVDLCRDAPAGAIVVSRIMRVAPKPVETGGESP